MNNPLTKILQFLDEIGIVYNMEPIIGDTFLPGLKIRNGTLIIDEARLLYPGDVLHEAGHLATMPPQIRITMDDNLEDNDLHTGGEMMAIAWSYAACIHLEIDPHIVFHEYGYKEGGAYIVENFSEGRFFGVPLLQWCGMAYEKKFAEQNNTKPFPHMLKWTCDQRPH